MWEIEKESERVRKRPRENNVEIFKKCSNREKALVHGCTEEVRARL